MDYGFTTVKDILDVVVVPVAIFAAGALIPRILDARKKQKFLSLIRKEVEEMELDRGDIQAMQEQQPDTQWPQHLKKRFVHKTLLQDVSENRDFILSLPPEVTYHLTQLWHHYDSATETADRLALQEHGKRWCDHLKKICECLNKHASDQLSTNIYGSWQTVIKKLYFNNADIPSNLQEQPNGLPVTSTKAEG